MKKLLLATTLVFSATAFAAPSLEQQIHSFEVKEITNEDFELFNSPAGIPGGVGGGGLPPSSPLPAPGQYDPSYPQNPYPSQDRKPTFGDKVDNVGKVISTAKDLVALGEAVYTLVQKGKPTNTTEYAPISVVPRDSATGAYADPFDLENFSIPVEKNYKVAIKNGNGKSVVDFAYKVVYSYGGSFNGSGSYLTNVMIIPSAVKTSFGWDFTATMKLSGIMNHGSKSDPVAGVMVGIKYQMNSWSTSFERNDTVHITGKGELKNYSAN